MANLRFFNVLLFLCLSLPVSAGPEGHEGNGGGVNGPDLAGVAIPSDDEVSAPSTGPILAREGNGGGVNGPDLSGPAVPPSDDAPGSSIDASLPLSSAKSSCAFFAPWLHARFLAQSSAPSKRSRAQARAASARVRLAEAIYRQHLVGIMPTASFETCLRAAELNELLPELSRVFFDNSLRRLANADVPALREMLAALNEWGLDDPIHRMRVVPRISLKQDGESDRRAGVYRKDGELFMNLGRVNSGEWLFVFSHELYHRLDDKISLASKIWSDQARKGQISELGKVHQDLRTLPSEEAAALTAYVRAGLDLGLLAEFRAWSLGLKVYQQGLEQCLWPKIPWMEKLLAHKGAQQTDAEFLFSYLDKSFVDPAPKGLFALPIVQQEYQRQRAELRRRYSPGSR